MCGGKELFAKAFLGIFLAESLTFLQNSQIKQMLSLVNPPESLQSRAKCLELPTRLIFTSDQSTFVLIGQFATPGHHDLVLCCQDCIYIRSCFISWYNALMKCFRTWTTLKISIGVLMVCTCLKLTLGNSFGTCWVERLFHF